MFPLFSLAPISPFQRYPPPLSPLTFSPLPSLALSRFQLPPPLSSQALSLLPFETLSYLPFLPPSPLSSIALPSPLFIFLPFPLFSALPSTHYSHLPSPLPSAFPPLSPGPHHLNIPPLPLPSPHVTHSRPCSRVPAPLFHCLVIGPPYSMFLPVMA